MNTTDQSLELVFTADEIARLRIYRAAVAAGFYTDDLPPSHDEAVSAAEGVYVLRDRAGEIFVLAEANASSPDGKED